MLKSIQILRAIAALGVVFTHYNFRGLDVGGFGVDIFFVLSGFIISYVVNQSTDHFLIKRIIRVVPLYTLATLCILLVHFIVPQSFKSLEVSFEAIIKSLLYIPYRINSSGPILSLGWTLNNEMFFYLVIFSCIKLVRIKKNIIPTSVFVLLTILILFSFLNVNSYIISFYKDGLLPEFIYGILLYFLWIKKIIIKKSVWFYLVIFLGFLSFIFMIYNDVTHKFQFFSRNLWRGIPSLIVVYSFLLIEDYINVKNKLVKISLRLGDSSYAMYLYHPFIIFGFTRLVYPYFTKNLNNLFLECILFFIAIVCLSFISILIHEKLDKPFNKYLRNKFIK